jgi:hypothetical protein
LLRFIRLKNREARSFEIKIKKNRNNKCEAVNNSDAPGINKVRSDGVD